MNRNLLHKFIICEAAPIKYVNNIRCDLSATHLSNVIISDSYGADIELYCPLDLHLRTTGSNFETHRMSPMVL
jgi:hypothetical protein